jgi:hypothetical protein
MMIVRFLKRLLRVVDEGKSASGDAKAFNAVVEGASQDSWSQSDTKLVYLELPERKEALQSGNQTFRFYGHTDFDTVTREDFRMEAYAQDDAAAEHVSSRGYRGHCERPDLLGDRFAERTGSIDDVTWCGGLSTFSAATQILPRPRAIIMENGDIYVERHMLSDGHYLQALDEIVPQTAEYFGSKELQEKYKRAMTPRAS